jgi:hypothetical protein
MKIVKNFEDSKCNSSSNLYALNDEMCSAAYTNSTNYNGSWDEVSPNHTYRAAPSISTNILEFDESWSRSQFYGRAYPIRSKEQRRIYDGN